MEVKDLNNKIKDIKSFEQEYLLDKEKRYNLLKDEIID